MNTEQHSAELTGGITVLDCFCNNNARLRLVAGMHAFLEASFTDGTTDGMLHAGSPRKAADRFPRCIAFIHACPHGAEPDGRQGKAEPGGRHEQRRAPSSPSSNATALALAEKALAEVTSQRDEAIEKLTRARDENSRLVADLEHARSYQALYAAAQEVGRARVDGVS